MSENSKWQKLTKWSSKPLVSRNNPSSNFPARRSLAAVTDRFSSVVELAHDSRSAFTILRECCNLLCRACTYASSTASLKSPKKLTSSTHWIPKGQSVAVWVYPALPSNFLLRKKESQSHCYWTAHLVLLGVTLKNCLFFCKEPCLIPFSVTAVTPHSPSWT